MWSLTEPVSGLSVVLVPSEGDISVSEDYETAVHVSRRGANRWVTEGARLPATIVVPDVVFRDLAGFETLRAIRNLSRRVVLVDDLGREFPSKFTGPFSYLEKDVPGRDEGVVLFYVKLSLVGVL